MNFFAHVTAEKAVLAGPLQAPGWVEPTLSKLLNLPADKIEIQMTRMGGGFGRRAYGQYLYEAALISKQAKAPVKLIYTREITRPRKILRFTSWKTTSTQRA